MPSASGGAAPVRLVFSALRDTQVFHSSLKSRERACQQASQKSFLPLGLLPQAQTFESVMTRTRSIWVSSRTTSPSRFRGFHIALPPYFFSAGAGTGAGLAAGGACTGAVTFTSVPL
jgi:hypothetical protein